MKGAAVMYRLALEVSFYDQAYEAADRQDEHHRGRGQRDRHDRTTDLSFAPLPQDSHPFQISRSKPRIFLLAGEQGVSQVLRVPRLVIVCETRSLRQRNLSERAVKKAANKIVQALKPRLASLEEAEYS
jgi:hypothetical protein